MSMIRPTSAEKLDSITNNLSKYRTLLAKHTARGNESGCRMVSIMVERTERKQARYAGLVGLTVNQANHLYL